MNQTDLGPCHVTFSFNKSEWERNKRNCGCLIAMGVFAVATACYQWGQSSNMQWLLAFIGLSLSALSCVLCFKLRPNLLAIGAHEEGLHLVCRDTETSIRWSDIAVFTESTHAVGEDTTVQLGIQTVEGMDYFFNDGLISDFDAFKAFVEGVAKDRGLEWVKEAA